MPVYGISPKYVLTMLIIAEWPQNILLAIFIVLIWWDFYNIRNVQQIILREKKIMRFFFSEKELSNKNNKISKVNCKKPCLKEQKFTRT
jgi:hypothetical protein